LPICAIFNAGRSEIATATYQKKYGKWQQLVKADIVTVEHLCKQTTKKTLFCGGIFTGRRCTNKNSIERESGYPTADTGFQTRQFSFGTGRQRLNSGNIDDAVTLQPIYLRRRQSAPEERVVGL